MYWSGWWDEPQEGVMTVPVTGEVLTEDTYAPFGMGAPNGHELENCVGVSALRGIYNDEFCYKKTCGFCDLEASPKMQIRGLTTRCAYLLCCNVTLCALVVNSAHVHTYVHR